MMTASADVNGVRAGRVAGAEPGRHLRARPRFAARGTVVCHRRHETPCTRASGTDSEQAISAAGNQDPVLGLLASPYCTGGQRHCSADHETKSLVPARPPSLVPDQPAMSGRDAARTAEIVQSSRRADASSNARHPESAAARKRAGSRSPSLAAPIIRPAMVSRTTSDCTSDRPMF